MGGLDALRRPAVLNHDLQYLHRIYTHMSYMYTAYIYIDNHASRLKNSYMVYMRCACTPIYVIHISEDQAIIATELGDMFVRFSCAMLTGSARFLCIISLQLGR